MKKVNKALMRKLAYEERLGLYCLAQNKEINNEEIFGSLQMVEDLTKLNLTSNGFDAQSMSVVGIDTCCNYFKTLCEQYRDLIVNGEDGKYIAHQRRMDIVIGSTPQQVKPRIVDIGLYDAAKIIDDAISDNYIELIEGSMKGNDDKRVYQYAMFNTFAGMYYQIRDLIEGKSYYDGQFMTENRELPEEYERQSQGLISSFMERAKVTSSEVAKNQLLNALNEGISSLKNIPLENSLDNVNQKNNAQKIEELRQAYFAEHGYPGQSESPKHM